MHGMFDTLNIKSFKWEIWYYSMTKVHATSNKVWNALVRTLCDSTGNKERCCAFGKPEWRSPGRNGEYKSTENL
jgi:hypothetical protein